MTNREQGIKLEKKAVLRIVLTVVLMGMLTVAFDVQQVVAVDWWPMFHHDLSHTGYSSSEAPNTNEVSWSYSTGGEVSSSPAVFDDKLYVGSYDHKVYCFDAYTGDTLWTYPTGGAVHSSPAVEYDHVYVGSDDNRVYCLNYITGDSIWTYETDGAVMSSPAVAYFKVFVGSHDQKVYCLDEFTGALIWIFAPVVSGGFYSSPAVADGRVYVAALNWYGAGEKIFCLPESDPDGSGIIEPDEVIWSFVTDGVVYSSPAIADGRLYVGSQHNKIYCLNATTGDSVWCYTTGSPVWSSPAVADGKVYVGSFGRKIYCLNAATGDSIWCYTTGGPVISSPAVAQGKVYVGSGDDKVYCLNASNGDFIWSYTTGGDVESSPAVAGGRVYVGSKDNNVYAFGPLFCQVSPTSLDFDTVTVGSYLDKTFTITNTGGKTLYGGVSEWCDHYSIVSGGGSFNIPPGDFLTVIVRFEPTSSGTKTCTIETGPDFCSDVSCTGVGEYPPACQVSPTSLDFDSVAVGSYLDKTFTITNTGGGTLSGNVSELCDHYSIVSGGGAYSLGAGESVTVTVRFEPNSAGQHNCTIETGNDLCSDVFCTGVGVEPACQVSPTSLDFGTVIIGSHLDKTFTITNTGGGTLTGSVSESCDHYSIVSGGGAYSLGAGEWITVTVRFEPTSTGQHNCTIETGNALCSDVSCTGVGQSPCQVSPTSLSFGSVMVGSYLDKTFKITNIGGETLTGTVSESCDHYDIVSGGGAYSLNPGDSVIVTVRFEPASPGQHNCTIETGNALCSDVYCTGVGAGEWYWKSPYEDYAPSGMPDIDQKQDNWIKEDTDQWTFCGPCAVANCFKWFDSKYNEGLGGWPGDGMDAFPLVRDYMDDLLPFYDWDDHDPWNVDHIGTEWNPGVGWPPATDQPFLPGPQPQPSPMPPWGELVERLAWYFDTDGIQTGYCSHAGTNILQMQQGIQDWLESEMFEDGSTLADTLCAVITARPTFAYVESLVEKSENVILLLGFWYPREAPIQQQFQEFIRGEINEDGIIDLGDIILCWQEGPFSCDDAADANDDGILDVGTVGADCIYLSNYIFQGGPPPPPPYPNCGLDPTPDELDCGSFALCGSWWRVGGHYVTVAGVNSTEQKIAVSDPFIDAAELGLAEGRVGDGWLIDHPWGSHDPTVHNDEGNVSHDMYVVDTSSISPGGDWWLPEYPRTIDPFYPMTWWMGNFFNQNVPDEFVDKTQEWDEVSPIFTEVEYCVHISPWDYRGDCNGDGIVELGDIVYLINYAFRGGDPPVPYWEGDVNCDGVIELGDIVFLINYAFRGGDIPRCCDP